MLNKQSEADLDSHTTAALRTPSVAYPCGILRTSRFTLTHHGSDNLSAMTGPISESRAHQRVAKTVEVARCCPSRSFRVDFDVNSRCRGSSSALVP